MNWGKFRKKLVDIDRSITKPFNAKLLKPSVTRKLRIVKLKST